MFIKLQRHMKNAFRIFTMWNDMRNMQLHVQYKQVTKRQRTGMKAGGIAQTILHLAGFKNVKSKVVGSRNPHNTVEAFFKAFNATETPRDVQEKFGRAVVQK